MDAPPPAGEPPPPTRRFEPHRRDGSENVIRWLRVLGGRFQPESASRRAAAARGTASSRTRSRPD